VRLFFAIRRRVEKEGAKPRAQKAAHAFAFILWKKGSVESIILIFTFP
jgi:hypothetical protein